MSNMYLLTSMFILLILGISWSKAGIWNWFVKIACVSVGLWGLVVCLQSFGYIIKV